MKTMKFLLAALLLAACVPEEPEVVEQSDACKSASYQGLIGQPRAALEQMQLPAGTRIIAVGDPVTRDYRVERLNFELDAAGRVAKISCY